MIKKDEIQSLQQGHRARLRQKFLDDKLAEYEMLELLLTYAIPRRDVRLLARQLYNKYGNIQRLLAEPMDLLMDNKGIKENTAVFLKLLSKLTELNYKCVLTKAPVFHDYENLIKYCQLIVGGKAIEEFHVLYLDGQFKLIADELHSSGTIDWAAVYVREIVKRALDLNARGVILLHNHPTPELCFSQQDVDITKEIDNALSQLDIHLYDHLLVSGSIVYSARNLGLLDRPLK